MRTRDAALLLIILVSLSSILAAAPYEAREKPVIKKESFGKTPDGAVDLYTITNANGVELRVTNYGGIIVSLAGWPSIRAKALSRTKISSAVPSTAFFAREVEDQDSGNLTLNHISGEDRFHQPSIRPSTSAMILLCEHPTSCGMRERPINPCGLACADQGQPRAALDANDLWIGHVGAQHPVESYG